MSIVFVFFVLVLTFELANPKHVCVVWLTAICTIVTITVIVATISLSLKHRMKHILSRGPYLFSSSLHL